MCTFFVHKGTFSEFPEVICDGVLHLFHLDYTVNSKIQSDKTEGICEWERQLLNTIQIGKIAFIRIEGRSKIAKFILDWLTPDSHTANRTS